MHVQLRRVYQQRQQRPSDTSDSVFQTHLNMFTVIVVTSLCHLAAGLYQRWLVAFLHEYT
jgi:hypothetical protein